jgi:acyl carrier protein
VEEVETPSLAVNHSECVVAIIREVIGPDRADILALHRDASFVADLELTSIEFVVLGDRLLQHYGDTVDLVGWFWSMELEAIMSLTVGDLIDFIETGS